MPKVSAISWKGGTGCAAVVSSASVAQSRTAMPPIAVARRRAPAPDWRTTVSALAERYRLL
jgi:hypothetical protein